MTITLLSAKPDESDLVIKHTQQEVELVITPPWEGSEAPLQGTLIVSESQIYFYSEQSKTGIAVDYPDVIIHATSREDDRPLIYCQLDQGLFFPNQKRSELDDDAVTELRFIPKDDAVAPIYLALNHCASLHPDEEQSEEDEGDFDAFVDPSNEDELSEAQQAALHHLESVFQPDPTNSTADSFVQNKKEEDF